MSAEIRAWGGGIVRVICDPDDDGPACQWCRLPIESCGCGAHR